MQKKIIAFRNKPSILKEEEIKFPNMDSDIKTDIEEFNNNMGNYINRFDNNSHKFYKNNVIFNGKSIVKNIEFNWSYSLDAEGCVISIPTSTSSFPLYNEIIEFFDDLKIYYTVWKDKWTEKYTDITK